MGSRIVLCSMVLAACASNERTEGSCEIELSGAVSRTLPCDDAPAVLYGSDNDTVVFTFLGEDDTLTFTGGVTLAGEPSTGRFEPREDEDCGFLANEAGAAWSTQDPDPCVLVLDEVEQTGGAGGINSYRIAGELQTTLSVVEFSAATAPLQVTVRFD